MNTHAVNEAGDPNSISGALLGEPSFQYCQPQDLARFLPHVSEKLLQAGEVLHLGGEQALHAFLIVEGAFELSDRDRVTGALENGFLGEEAAIGMDQYVTTATAVKPSKVLVMPAQAIVKLADFKPLRQRLLASFSGRFTDETGSKPYSLLGVVAETAEQPRVVIGWLCALLLPAGIFFFFNGKDILPSLQALYLLCIISVTVTMWVFRLLPDFVPALFGVLATILLGVAPAEVALKGFSSDSFFMALSILGLSVVISVSGLSYRVLLWLLRLGPANKIWYNFSLFITGLALTPVVPTTNGRVAIVAPFLNDLLVSFDKESAKKEAPRLSVNVLSGVSLLSAIFLSSKSVNFVVFGLLPFQEQQQFQWLYWFYAASVCGAVLLIFYVLGSWLLFRNDSRPCISKALVERQNAILGKITAAEWAGIAGLLVLFLSFTTAALHRINVPWVALAILFSLLMFGFLEKSAFREKIDWSFLVFLGALIGLVAAMRHIGLDVWLTSNLSWLNVYMEEDFPSFLLMLAVAIFVVRLALPINATVIIFATLLIPTAISIGFNPWIIGFVILLMSESFIWPYQASYFSQFMSITGPEARADNRNVAIFHFMIFIFKLAAIYATIPFWRYIGLL